jgi:hypothetical protein
VIGLVHLVWAPLGPEPVRAFVRSYRAHPAGAEHELVVLCNGTKTKTPSQGVTRETLMAELQGVEHRLLVLERPLLDLAAYGEAARQLEHEQLCFLNSYSVIQVDGWLGHLARAAQLAGVGLVGATGSWESKNKLARGNAWHWAFQLATLPRTWYRYARFPNPHIRTTAFMLDRRLALQLGLARAHKKHAAYVLESGRHSITRQLQARGLRAVVVGADGRTYERDEWPASHTYRSGGQENLLVTDNRTRQWEQAPEPLRDDLSRWAWGAQAGR